MRLRTAPCPNLLAGGVQADRHARDAHSGLAQGGGGILRGEIAVAGQFDGGVADGGDFF